MPDNDFCPDNVHDDLNDKAPNSSEHDEDPASVTQGTTLEGCLSNSESACGSTNATPRKRSIPCVIDYLKELNISSYAKTWVQYEQEVRTTGDKLFDFIISDLPFLHSPSTATRSKPYMTFLDDSGLKELCQHFKRMVKNGSYVLLFIHPRLFVKLSDHLEESGFIVMDKLCSAIKSQDSVQGFRLSIFPQNNSDFMLIARYQGSHPQSFNPDFSGEFNELQDGMKRRFSSISNVPGPKNKLCIQGTRSPVRTEEKNVEFVKELISLYCMENGSVYVPFAGAMEIIIACVHSGRSCVALERDERCYNLALERVKMVARNVYENMSNTPQRLRPTNKAANVQGIIDFNNSSSSEEDSSDESERSGIDSSSKADGGAVNNEVRSLVAGSAFHDSSSDESDEEKIPTISTYKLKLIPITEFKRGQRVTLVQT